MMKFSSHSDAHSTENSTLVTEGNRLKLYAEWRRYWNVSRPVLVEKSPIHTLKTRFLQAMFTAERTFFIVAIRHPLPSMLYTRAKSRHSDCSDFKRIQSWLYVVNTMFDDLLHVEHYVIMRFEEFVQSEDPYGLFDVTMELL